jgi:hypothetical protein
MLKRAISGGTAHKIPTDLQKVLLSDKTALYAWESITALARNEWICWITFVKKKETRAAHIKRTQEQLKEGKHRPCCWMGCMHRSDKPTSPSVRGILKRKPPNSSQT